MEMPEVAALHLFHSLPQSVSAKHRDGTDLRLMAVESMKQDLVVVVSLLFALGSGLAP